MPATSLKRLSYTLNSETSTEYWECRAARPPVLQSFKGAAQVMTVTCKGMACSEQESFDVDQKRLERQYKQLQSVYHPDKKANASQVHTTLHSFPVPCPLASEHRLLEVSKEGELYLEISLCVLALAA